MELPITRNAADSYAHLYPLHAVIRENLNEPRQYVEKINKILKDNNVNINQHDADIYGYTPLHCAASRGFKEVIRKLLSYKGRTLIDSLSYYKCETPLHIAVENNHIECVRVLLKFGADPNSRSAEFGSTPLHTAARKGHAKILDCLLQYGAINHPNMLNKTPLHEASILGNINEIELLLNYKVINVNIRDSSNKTALQLAIQALFPEYSGIFLGRGDIDFQIKTVLKTATRRNDRALVSFLMKFNSIVNDSTKFLYEADLALALFNAAADGFVEVARILLNHGVNIDYKIRTNTFLYVATLNKRLPMVKFLINRGAEVNIKCYHERTALHEAANNNHYQIAKELLRAGANPNIFDRAQETPLHEASMYEGIAQLFVDYDADIFAKNNSRKTPIHVSLELGKHSVFMIYKWHFACLLILKEHLGTPMNPKDLARYANLLGDLSSPTSTFRKDIEKTETVLSGDLTFLDILTENIRKFQPHMNETNSRRINHFRFKQEVGSYARLIRCKYRKCCGLAKLLEPIIVDHYVSLYDILIAGHYPLVKLLGNKEIIKIVDTYNFREIAPRYSLELSTKYTAAKKTRKLIDEIIQGMSETLNAFKLLTNLCIEKIWSYLDDEDLDALKRALWFEEPSEISSDASSALSITASEVLSASSQEIDEDNFVPILLGLGVGMIEEEGALVPPQPEPGEEIYEDQAEEIVEEQAALAPPQIELDEEMAEEQAAAVLPQPEPREEIVEEQAALVPPQLELDEGMAEEQAALEPPQPEHVEENVEEQDAAVPPQPEPREEIVGEQASLVPPQLELDGEMIEEQADSVPPQPEHVEDMVDEQTAAITTQPELSEEIDEEQADPVPPQPEPGKKIVEERAAPVPPQHKPPVETAEERTIPVPLQTVTHEEIAQALLRLNSDSQRKQRVPKKKRDLK